MMLFLVLVLHSLMKNFNLMDYVPVTAGKDLLVSEFPL